MRFRSPSRCAGKVLGEGAAAYVAQADEQKRAGLGPRAPRLVRQLGAACLVGLPGPGHGGGAEPSAPRRSCQAPTAPGVSLGAVSSLAALEPVARGKVRDIFAVGENRLLLVTSDRISTYDVVHPTPIPDKGAVLTGLSDFWFGRTEDLVPNHVISYRDVPDEVRGRALLVERLEMFPIECVVRGYITGSGWKDYQSTGAVCGIELPEGLEESEQLPEPIFTPATKAEVGDHDENVSFDRAVEILEEERIGDREALEDLRRLSIGLYARAAVHARARGIILADTKFEFGRDGSGRIVVGDEMLTPDSSRFWPTDGYEVGRGQPSFDKQYVRDWAAGSGWDKAPPAPELPEDVVSGTRERYRDAYERIAGEPLDGWLRRSGAAPSGGAQAGRRPAEHRSLEPS